ncbi:MAG TPA: glycosyltransferase family 4 protein [Gemmatimonadaceae bacterium]|nr:glycosyltransferase family 4 protein [Gemmatimonadaceae bacterium]
MRPLRFCFVTTFYPPYNFGGDGIGVQRWARALVSRGHQVTVLCDADTFNALSDRPADKVVEDDGVVVERVSTGLAPLSLLLTHQLGRPVLNATPIRRVLAQREFDVINYHNVSMIGGPAVLAEGRGIKLYTAWEHWLVCPTHVLWRHRRERCDGRECVRCSLHYNRLPQLWRYGGYFEKQLANVDAFIALSEFSRKMHKQFGFAREMEVIPGFLQDDRRNETRETGSSPHHRPFFFFAGRLERIKGLDDVIPVFRDYPHADLLIAGDGDHRQALQQIASGIPNVRFLGRLPMVELNRYYSHAVATLVPSVGYETFGFVVIEAFRRGSPVIARRVGPLPELIEQCGGGETFDTPAELAVALRRIQMEPGRREALSFAASEGFGAHWSESAVVPRYFELLERLAGQGKKRELASAIGAGL